MFAGESTAPWGEDSVTATTLYGYSLLFSTTEIVGDTFETERLGAQLKVNMVSSNHAVSGCVGLRVKYKVLSGQVG